MSVGIIPFFSFNEPIPLGLTYGRWAVGRSGGSTTQRIQWSDDGINWTLATTPTSGFQFYTAGLDFSPELGLYAACSNDSGNTNIMTSTNSVTWTLRNKGDSNALISIKWCPAFGLWIAAGFNKTFSSPDGINWTTRYTYRTNYLTLTRKPYYDEVEGIWATIITTNLTTGPIYSVWTNDGINYNETQINSQTDWGRRYGFICLYRPEIGRAVVTPGAGAGGSLDRLLITDDITGTASTYYTPPGGGNRNVYGGNSLGGLYQIGLQGFSTQPVWYSSTAENLASWTASTFPNANYLTFDIDYTDVLNQWVMTLQNSSTIFTSDDGIVWTSRTSVGSDNESAVFGPGVRTTAYKEGADK